jgi:protein-S-isoprenylcysteine O-methyltransferase Ste14
MSLSRIRVRAGYVAGLIVVVFAEPTTASLAAGGALAIAGELVRIWASGHIRKTLALATGGPYAHTRNPLYVGSVLMAAGLLAAARHPAAIAAGALYIAVFYPAIVREEAAFLRSKFGEAYEAWAREVPIFFPRLTPGGPRETKFEAGRLLANHEWRTVLGLVALAALMVWRSR